MNSGSAKKVCHDDDEADASHRLDMVDTNLREGLLNAMRLIELASKISEKEVLAATQGIEVLYRDAKCLQAHDKKSVADAARVGFSANDCPCDVPVPPSSQACGHLVAPPTRRTAGPRAQAGAMLVQLQEVAPMLEDFLGLVQTGDGAPEQIAARLEAQLSGLDTSIQRFLQDLRRQLAGNSSVEATTSQIDRVATKAQDCADESQPSSRLQQALPACTTATRLRQIADQVIVSLQFQDRIQQIHHAARIEIARAAAAAGLNDIVVDKDSCAVSSSIEDPPGSEDIEFF